MYNGGVIIYFREEMPIRDCCTFLCVRTVLNLLYGVTGISVSSVLCFVFAVIHRYISFPVTSGFSFL